MAHVLVDAEPAPATCYGINTAIRGSAMFIFIAANIVGLTMLELNALFLFGLRKELKRNDLN
jgi:hypothetical protein